MKEAELRKHLTCDLCNRKITATGLPLFWRVKVERFGIDAQAVQRQHGLAMHLGSPVLASIMGTDPDMAKPVMDPVTLTLCEGCALDDAAGIVHAALSKKPEEVDHG